MKRIALLVGVDSYADACFTSLHGSMRDASELSGFLKHGLPDGKGFDTRFLSNPSAKQVVDELLKIVKELDDESTFLFYFAGHGLNIGKGSGQALICSDATRLAVEGVSETGTISSNVMTHFARHARGNLFLIFDVCRQPALRTRSGATPTEGSERIRTMTTQASRIRDDGEAANTWVLSSCADGQSASDDGIFVKSVIQTMENYLRAGVGIQLGDLFLRRVAEAIHRQDPSSKQYPVASGIPFPLVSAERRAAPAAGSATPSPVAEASEPAASPSSEELEIPIPDLASLSEPLEDRCFDPSEFEERPAGTRQTMVFSGQSYGFRYCPAGWFLMGSPLTEQERYSDELQHKVKFSRGFWMLETLCPQTLWTAVMGDNPSAFKGDNLPVERVSYKDCRLFLSRLNDMIPIPAGYEFRFPTESEWEYACRAGTTTAFWWGSGLNGSRATCIGTKTYGSENNGVYYGKTTPLRHHPANAWGLHDMHGNLCEWCFDWYEEYPTETVQDPCVVEIEPSNLKEMFQRLLRLRRSKGGEMEGAGRVRRGGGWNSRAAHCRAAYRSSEQPDFRNFNLGFRFVLAPMR